MSGYIKHIEAKGVYGRFDIEQKFYPNVNIFFGKNGTGKTTLLHILANLLNEEYRRFAFLPFYSIDVYLKDRTINLQQREENRKVFVAVKLNGKTIEDFPVSETRKELLEREMPHHQSDSRPLTVEETNALLESPQAAYFPAFRTIIEAWSNVSARDREIERLTRLNRATKQSRKLFGPFVPLINYPSTVDIERGLSLEIRQAELTLGRTDQQLLAEAFMMSLRRYLKGQVPSLTGQRPFLNRLSHCSNNSKTPPPHN